MMCFRALFFLLRQSTFHQDFGMFQSVSLDKTIERIHFNR